MSDPIALPPPRDGSSHTTPSRPERPYRIALVCLGNICRSPTAHVVLAEHLRAAGLADRVEVDSFGTGGWHIGERMDRRSAATLTAAGYDATQHRAQQLTADRRDDFDLVLAMDRDNLRDLARLGIPAERMRLFGAFDPAVPGGEVPDPYYGGPDGFEEVLAMVERTSARLVGLLREGVPTGAEAPLQDRP
ncbi:MAG: low molecular weight protein-tyrosine-phosphatase [Nocardioides sp.]